MSPPRTISTAPLALSTMPEGKAEDFPTVFRCGSPSMPVHSAVGAARLPTTIFQYGDHSNHSGTILRSIGRDGDASALSVANDQVFWFRAKESKVETLALPRSEDSVTVSLAAGPNGEAIVGRATSLLLDGSAAANLIVLKRGEKQPVWGSAGRYRVDAGPALEKGEYGTPTLPDGSHAPLPQRDVKVFAPLSLAAYASPAKDAPGLRIASADYQGWQRWLRSSATGKDQNGGTTFLPTRPTVTVYDGQGKSLRQFTPNQFARPQWLDLAFLPGV